MKTIIGLFVLVISTSIQAQRNYRITGSSIGGISLGMTLGQARRTLPDCSFKRASDGEGVALVGVTCHGRDILSLYADESDVDKKIDWRKKIIFIETFNKNFQTREGVHPGMKLVTAERVLGKVRQILITQIESREFVIFTKKTPGIEYRTYGGVYTRPHVITTNFERGSAIWSIQISKP